MPIDVSAAGLLAQVIPALLVLPVLLNGGTHGL